MPPQQLHTFLRFGGGVRTTSGVFSVRVWFQRGCLAFCVMVVIPFLQVSVPGGDQARIRLEQLNVRAVLDLAKSASGDILCQPGEYLVDLPAYALAHSLANSVSFLCHSIPFLSGG